VDDPTELNFRKRYKMYLKQLFFLLIITLFSSAVFGQEEIVTEEKTSLSGHDKKMAEFIIGVSYLENKTTLSPAEKGLWYKKLCKITGVTTQAATNFLNTMKNNPKKWAEIMNWAAKAPTNLQLPVPEKKDAKHERIKS